MMKKKCACGHCHRKATNGSYCAEHYQPKQKRHFEDHALYNTARWKRLSKSIRAENPICQKCQEQLSAVVDHIIEIRWANSEDLWHDENNLWALCHQCHQNKTLAVAKTIQEGTPTHATLLVLRQLILHREKLATVEKYFKNSSQD